MLILTQQLIAQEINNPVIGPELAALNGVSFFQKLLPALILMALILGVIIFFFMLIIGAVQWISSGGDKAATEAARGRITNAIVGLVILLSFFAITQLLGTFFGIDILRLDIQPLFIGTDSTPGTGPTPIIGTANPNCPCSAALGGGCASTGAIAVGPRSECYECISSGWSGPISGSCGPMSCSPCP